MYHIHKKKKNVSGVTACVHAKLLQLCQIPCSPMNCSPPGPSAHVIPQARILEWVSIFSFRGIFPAQGMNEPTSLVFPALSGRFFSTSVIWEGPGGINGI